MPWLEPCGRKCDWMRSGYDVDMLFNVDDDPVRVRWFKTLESAEWMPEGNVFASDNWNDRDSEGGDLGEQPGLRPWKNGANTKGYKGDVTTCIDPTWFNDGIPTGETTGDWDTTTTKLSCCEGQFCESLEDDLQLEIVNLAGCSTLSQIITLSRIGLCTWQGTLVTDLGLATTTVEFLAPDWTISIDCFAGTDSAATSTFDESPFKVEWDLSDPGFCCTFSGTDTFHAILTSPASASSTSVLGDAVLGDMVLADG